MVEGLLCGQARALDLHGVVDLRAAAVSASPSWLHGGMGKLRYDDSGVRLGQATLEASGELLDQVVDNLSATVVANIHDDRRGAAGVNEAFISWNPVPGGPWKTRVKAGAFFPVTSLELDYDSVGWTPTRTVSSSAINSWIGEELRTKGIELTFSRNGRLAGSPHDFSITAALYKWNDETGTLLAWRGWSISERITSLTEPLPLPDLPVYREGTGFIDQTRAIHPFREIDDRTGFYVSSTYAWRGWLELTAMHYDNRANPMAYEDDQWGWTTRFNHVGLRARPGNGWEWVLQAMDGSTLVGPRGVNARYRSWFALASHALGPGTATLRYDHFGISEDDIAPADPNTEHGHALALAYALELRPEWTLVTEALRVDSTRAARALIGVAPRQRERSLSVSLRYRF
ncbi:MAG: hypothetical protein ACLGI6_00060 [Gammaproteobacteria bacterium]